MVTGIIGRKIGMTQVFDPDGTVHPATVIKAGPCVVVQEKTKQTDGYEALQLGFVEETPTKANKPTVGHFKKANVPATRVRREIALAAGGDTPKTGDQVLVSAVFALGERVDIIGTSRGKGFQGVVKRHHFKGGRMSHGSMFHRAPGSIGASSDPSRVWPGHKLPGRMGGDRRTVLNISVVRVLPEQNLVLVRGAVPGANGSLVMLRKSVKTKKVSQQPQAAGKK